ncbi:conserved hypothetical protein [Trichormus variabilis ATCC 29413]|uniref:Uncharacterized protein n=1 Tax=Trichormus variabilis (strain ATCC 29413 / PCC 7937) TaxID=240292 RepID=Q3M9H6_TRIV2|nr:conserved hypothetical protein [Trichormus variabilis ATCC 29413]
MGRSQLPLAGGYVIAEIADYSNSVAKVLSQLRLSLVLLAVLSVKNFKGKHV